MNYLNLFFKPLNMLLEYIDNSSFLKKPMTWFYLLLAVVAAVIPLYVCYQVIDSESLGMISARGLSGWSKFVWVIEELLIVLTLLGLAAYSFMMWFKRAKHLDNDIRRGDVIVAIPVFAHFVQTIFEYVALLFSVLMVMSGVMTFIFMILTWPFNDFGDFLKFGLLMPIAMVVVGCLVGYLFVFLGHVIGENWRVKAILGNNVRDMGDILRSSTMEE